MLRLIIPLSPEGWDEAKQQFVEPKSQVLELEHSLISLSKWESTWKKPFYTNKEKTDEEVLDYIKCMTLSENVDPDVYNHLTSKNVDEIQKYISDPMTATTFSKQSRGNSSREIVTAELIYYWMLTANVPFDRETWPLNKLITLLEVCAVKNAPAKKRSRSEMMRERAALNEARKKQWNTRG